MKSKKTQGYYMITGTSTSDSYTPYPVDYNTRSNNKTNTKKMDWIGEPNYALAKHNKPTAEMTKFYEKCGFDVSWDYDRKYHWDELFLDDKLVIQVEQSITKEQFLKAVDDLLEDPDADFPFFMASPLSDNEFRKLLIKHFK